MRYKLFTPDMFTGKRMQSIKYVVAGVKVIFVSEGPNPCTLDTASATIVTSRTRGPRYLTQRGRLTLTLFTLNLYSYSVNISLHHCTGKALTQNVTANINVFVSIYILQDSSTLLYTTIQLVAVLEQKEGDK